MKATGKRAEHPNYILTAIPDVKRGETSLHRRTQSQIAHHPVPSTYYGGLSAGDNSRHRNVPMHRRSHSTITTIVRPKYLVRPSSIDTTNVPRGEPMPFIPVSPDSSDEEADACLPQPSHLLPPPLPQRTTSAVLVRSPFHLNPTSPVGPSQYDKQRASLQSLHRTTRQQNGTFPYEESRRASVSDADTPKLRVSGEQTLSIERQRQDALRSLTSHPVTDYALLSNLSEAFIHKIKALAHVRELFCANEYPESFTGQEAVKALREILARKHIPDGYCIVIANALMNGKPFLFEPIHYSLKSRITNTVFNSPDEVYTFDEEASENDVPKGVFTSLTRCYSYSCQRGQGECYVPFCPNKQTVFDKEFMAYNNLSRQSSVRSTMSTEKLTRLEHTAWAQRMPRELLETIPRRERERQEAINELIYSEEVFMDDLDILHELFAEPLSKSNTIHTERKRHFMHTVFNNYNELREMSKALFRDLFELQRRNEGQCVPMVGDILIQHFPYFEKPFTAYCPPVALAEYTVKLEKKRNMEFNRFMVEAEKNERARRLAFRHFLLNPVTRMQRYPLLLQAIIKKTDQEHPDYAYLVQCKQVIQSIAAKADRQSEATKKFVEILKIRDAIVFKQGEFHDLQLDDVNRRLYYSSDLKRRGQGIDMSDKADIRAFVFDHLFLMTKVRKTGKVEDYLVWRRPIPLQMLTVQGSAESHGLYPYSRSSLTSSTSTLSLSASMSTFSGGTLLTLTHLGQQREGIYHFYCPVPEDKQKWIKAIEEAKAALKKRQGDSDAFEMRTLDDSASRASRHHSINTPGRVNCSVPFVTKDGEHKLAMGTDNGVYFKSMSQDGGVQRILTCDAVTQLEVMEKHRILLVLADKTLKAFPIDALVSPTSTRTPERLAYEVARHVGFFQVGICNNKHLVVCKRKKNAGCFFYALEPSHDWQSLRLVTLFQQRSGLLGQRPSSTLFKKYKEFFIGADASNLHILKTKMSVVVESRGFEIIDLENLGVGGRNIPDPDDPQFNFIQRHGEHVKPLAMYRIQDKFLFCYNKFAFYVNNRNGLLANPGHSGKLPVLFEWGGTPESVAYHHPYIIGLDSTFIEIRHVDTGELAQIIPGENIQLAYYNGNGDAPVVHVSMTYYQSDTPYQRLFQLSPKNHHHRIHPGYPRR